MPRGIAEILADAADQHIVLARGIDRHREVILGTVIDDLDARRRRQDRADLVLGDRLLAFEGDCFAMGAPHRHADAGHADRDLFVFEDLAGFLDDLGFLVVVAGLGINSGVMVEQVEGVGMRHHPGRIDLPVEIGAGRFHELFHRSRPGAARGLVGRDDHALDAVLLMDRPQRHQRGDRGAVRVGNDALVIANAVRVDLGDHQRHVRVHAEGGGIVDHDGAGLDRGGRELPGDAATCREQRDIDAFKGMFGDLFDHDLLAAERNRLAGRPRARQRLQFADRETALVHGGDELGADRTGYADNRDDGIVTHLALHFF